MKSYGCILIVLISVISLNCAPADQHRLAAKRLVGLVSPTEAMVTGMVTLLEPLIIPKDASIEQIREFRDAIQDYAAEVAEDPELRRRMEELYMEIFSVSEMDQLVAFYSTPLGEKTLSEMPRLFQQGALIGQEVGKKHEDEFTARLSAITK